MKRQSGFTLIELIIVIVILGILAVTAAPQFFNFGSDARESTVRGMEGSVKAAADLVFARSAIEGIDSNDTETENADGINTIYGYPTATEDGIVAALNANFDDDGDWVFAHDDDGTALIAPFGFNNYGNATGFNEIDACYVQYVEATGQGQGERPVITVNLECG